MNNLVLGKYDLEFNFDKIFCSNSQPLTSLFCHKNILQNSGSESLFL